MPYLNWVYCFKYILLTLAVQGLAILDHRASQAHKTKKSQPEDPPGWLSVT
jgi:hypothetical protein